MRPKILLSAFIFIFIVLIYRLSYWQVIKGESLANDQKNQSQTSKQIEGLRGNILASDKSFWALRSDSWSMFLETKKIKLSPHEISVKIAPLIDSDEKDLENLLSQKKNWILINPKIDTDTKKNIEALKIDGIGFELGQSRYYPEASSAAQILGFVGKDETNKNVGYFGLEGYYNLPLSGKVGFKGIKKDAKGLQISTENSVEVNASNGVNLVTSIDKRIQLTIEEKLKEGIEKYGAIGGSVTVMDPTNGKILSMTSLPSYDPTQYQKYSDSLFKNPVISDSFEPGSIFKPLIMAAGINEGLITPQTECDNCATALKIDKYLIKTWNDKYQANINMTDVIVHSDNVGMVFVGQKLGADKMYEYLEKFGIGQKTGIDLQGEMAPKLRTKGTWNIVDLATASFGQGIASTGIEMLRAVSVIANGGYLVTPHVVSSYSSDNWNEEVDFSEPKRVISQKASQETALMMVEAVNRGEAKWAKPAGFNNIAGKTGTAQIPVSGHYDENNTNHSFIGFAPYDKPKFIMLVTLKSPQSSPWAAETAAPLWFNIAKDLFPYLGVSPN